MRILDRYLIKQFISTLVFSILALYVIFLVVDMMENLDEFIDKDMTFLNILMYYLYFFPEILKLLVPVAMLMSTLFTIGKLSNLNEVTAMKSGGISLYRFMLPILILSILISGLHLYFNGWIVPKANIEKNNIEREQLGKGNSRTGPIYNLYFRESPDVNFHLQSYNSRKKTGIRAGLDYFNDSTRLKKTIESPRIYWDSTTKEWIFREAITRIFEDNKIIKVDKTDSLRIDLTFTHQKIVNLKRSVDEMTFDELRDYLTLQQKGGRDVKKELTDYYGLYAFPFANIIVVLFGVPFASVKKKGGIAVQIGAALVISFLYLIFTKVSQAVVLSTGISPVISAWFANGLFFVVGIINLIKTKT